MKDISKSEERRFIVKIASTELYSVPLSAFDLEEYLKREKVGGTIYYAPLVELGEVSITVDWKEILNRLENEGRSSKKESGSDTSDIAEGKGGELKEEGSSVRSEVDGVSRVVRDGGEGRSGGVVGELSDAEFEELLDVSSDNK